MSRWALAVVSLLLGALPLSAAVQAAQLKNLESQDLCVYWIVSTPEPGIELNALEWTTPLFQRLGPGETARIDLASHQSLLVVFVPWSQPLNSRTPCRGGLISFRELVSGKQFGLSSATFGQARPPSRFEAPLSDWGLNVPQFVLDGRGGDWARVSETARWGAPSTTAGTPTRLQIRVADQALWIHAQVSAGAREGTFSWVLKGQGRFWELFPRGSESRIWEFSSQNPGGRAVGWRVLAGDELEAWIPLERLDPEARQQLSVGRWQLRLVSTTENPDNSLLLDVKMGDLP